MISKQSLQELFSQSGLNKAFYYKLLKDNLAIPRAKELLDTRNPAGWIGTLGGKNTWTNRELEWYLAEDRLLFSCITDEECDKWVCILNYLAYKMKS